MPSCSLVGEVSSVTSTYKWVIKNFCTGCKSVDDRLISSEFPIFNAGVKTLWLLELYPKGSNDSSKDYLSLFLYNLSKATITINVSFAILNAKNEVAFYKIFSKQSLDKVSWGYPCFVSRDYVTNMENKILVDDELTVICEILLNPIKRKDTLKMEEENEDDEPETDDETEENKNSLRLLEFDTFERLITEEDKFSYVTLKIGKQTWKAHKCVLAKRSSVLATMFQEDIKDSVVNIENVEPEVFMEFLRYVYSGKVNDIKEIAKELLILSEKYKLDTLFQICETTLSNDLDVSNVVKRLKLVHTYKALNLKKTAVEFVISNAKDIVVIPDFKELKDVPDVLCEILHSMVKRDTNEE
ncbi:speckle-type POZ protein-like A [Nasonia vitripennis]|uniref:Uncharacterized protein n=1 Tax=Nasonia vitripennis TaxID=7425 RepID=A0A7M7HHC2_NASVI|nr:speckle-type POZ protein-like A [Nasonia vitripennis]